LLGCDLLVDELVDEGGIRLVLEQPPHEIGEQVAMGAHRSVYAATGALLLADELVEALAHAVEPLELEALPVARHGEDGGDGMGVVGRELRIEAVAAVEELAGAGKIARVGCRLAGEDGEVG